MQALARSFEHEQDRVVFLTFVLTGLRRSELQALRWWDVDLIENRLRVVDSKTETGERSIALSPSLAEALWQHRRTSAYRADSERVFCHPQKGSHPNRRRPPRLRTFPMFYPNIYPTGMT